MNTGAATVFTGLIGSRYGASVGGLFLALPAIFCASATLIEKHEIRRKREAGLVGSRRGREAAALDAAGAGLGSIGMLSCFRCWWKEASQWLSLAPRWLGWSSRWQPGSCGASCGLSRGRGWAKVHTALRCREAIPDDRPSCSGKGSFGSAIRMWEQRYCIFVKRPR
jgi:hypothetical protein